MRSPGFLLRSLEDLLMSLEVLLRSLGSYWGLLRCSLAATFVLHDDVINSYPYSMSQVIGCNRYSTVGVEMTSIRWFLRYAHCDSFLAAILELHYDVIHSYTCNVIQVIGCNRYGTGRRWNEVDRTVGCWDMSIVNVFLAAILELHDDVINFYTCNVIQVIGCNRYSTGRRWNEVDRTVGSWDIYIRNELLAAILKNGVLLANTSQCSWFLEEI